MTEKAKQLLVEAGYPQGVTIKMMAMSTGTWSEELTALKRYLDEMEGVLAHEIGHIVLHRNLYRANRFSSIAEWKEFINSITEEEHGWLEYQGYAFAGLILVPKEDLVRHTDELE